MVWRWGDWPAEPIFDMPWRDPLVSAGLDAACRQIARESRQAFDAQPPPWAEYGDTPPTRQGMAWLLHEVRQYKRPQDAPARIDTSEAVRDYLIREYRYTPLRYPWQAQDPTAALFGIPLGVDPTLPPGIGFRVRDGQGRVVAEYRWRPSAIDRDAVRTVPMEYPVPAPGSYRITARIRPTAQESPCPTPSHRSPLRRLSSWWASHRRTRPPHS